MSPQAPATPAPGVRELRPETRGAADRGEVGLGAGVPCEQGGDPGATRKLQPGLLAGCSGDASARP